jgi:hypothetical protein
MAAPEIVRSVPEQAVAPPARATTAPTIRILRITQTPLMAPQPFEQFQCNFLKSDQPCENAGVMAKCKRRPTSKGGVIVTDLNARSAARAVRFAVGVIAQIRRISRTDSFGRGRGCANNGTAGSANHATDNGTTNAACRQATDGRTGGSADQRTTCRPLTRRIACGKAAKGENHGGHCEKFLHTDSSYPETTDQT